MALKTVTGKVTSASNTALSSPTVWISLSQSAVITGTQEVLNSPIPVTIASDGTYSVQLQANGDLTPNTTYYTATEAVATGTVPQYVTSQLTFVVPQTAGPFVMSNIATPPPALGPAWDATLLHLAGSETLTGVKYHALGLATQAVEPSTSALNPHVIPSVPSLAGETWAPYPNGVDDTTVLDNLYTAWASGAQTTKLKLWYGTYRYNGTGWAGTDYNLEGMGYRATTILLGASSYFIKSGSLINTLDLKGINFSQGLGAVYFTRTGNNVSNYFFKVDLCRFRDYTQTAIGYLSADMPYWKIKHNIFWGLNSTTCIGAALNGGVDQSVVADNAFVNNAVHIKIGGQGQGLTLRNNDLIQFGAGTNRASIWFVPDTSGVNYNSNGAVLVHQKFGNENQDATDFRLLFADEAAGTDFTTKLPNLGADSVGVIQNLTVRDSMVNGSSGGGPFVYSTTPHVRACDFGEITIAGSPPSYLIQYRTQPFARDAANSRNRFGPIKWAQATEYVSIPISNATGVGYLSDYDGTFLDNQMVPNPPGGSDYTGYAQLCPVGVRAFTLNAGVTRSNVADTEGGIDAAEFIMASPGINAYATLTVGSIVVGDPVWVEFDLKQGSVSPTATVLIEVSEGGPTTYHWKRYLTCPPNWRHYRFLISGLRDNTQPYFAATAVSTGRFQLGRVRVYHAREPLPYSLHTFGGIAPGTPALATQLGMLYMGSGVPNNANGNNGDIYFRTDGGAGTTIYQKRTGAWAATGA